MRRRYADIRGWGDIGAAPIRRYPGLGGYRCIDVSVRRRFGTRGAFNSSAVWASDSSLVLLHVVSFVSFLEVADSRMKRAELGAVCRELKKFAWPGCGC